MALVSQLALGAVMLPDDAPPDPLAALRAISIFCQTGHDTGGHDQAPGRHHAADYALCPLSLSLALPAVVLTPGVLLPGPGPALSLRSDGLPQARAPPEPAFASAYPRGPPSLVLA